MYEDDDYMNTVNANEKPRNPHPTYGNEDEAEDFLLERDLS